jgi:hypothetical protein
VVGREGGSELLLCLNAEYRSGGLGLALGIVGDPNLIPRGDHSQNLCSRLLSIAHTCYTNNSEKKKSRKGRTLGKAIVCTGDTNLAYTELTEYTNC